MPANADTGAAGLVSLSTSGPFWTRFFMVSPLVLIGTKEPDGSVDIAPKHMAMPLGWEGRYCFVCTPRHATYANAVARGAFTVSFPRPSQVVQASLAAAPRFEDCSKPSLAALPTFPASAVDGVLVAGCYLFLECALDRVMDGFGDASLVVGRVVAASVDEGALRDAERDDGEVVRDVPLLAYLSPGRFTAVSESFSFPFPADFRR